jgi:tryptophanyl-tRNA synthetase
MSGVTGKSIATLEAEFEGKMYGHLKVEAGEAVVAMLEPLQERFKQYRADEAYLEQVMKQGAEKAKARAQATIDLVYKKIGMIV